MVFFTVANMPIQFFALTFLGGLLQWKNNKNQGRQLHLKDNHGDLLLKRLSLVENLRQKTSTARSTSLSTLEDDVVLLMTDENENSLCSNASSVCGSTTDINPDASMSDYVDASTKNTPTTCFKPSSPDALTEKQDFLSNSVTHIRFSTTSEGLFEFLDSFERGLIVKCFNTNISACRILETLGHNIISVYETEVHKLLTSGCQESVPLLIRCEILEKKLLHSLDQLTRENPVKYICVTKMIDVEIPENVRYVNDCITLADFSLTYKTQLYDFVESFKIYTTLFKDLHHISFSHQTKTLHNIKEHSLVDLVLFDVVPNTMKLDAIKNMNNACIDTNRHMLLSKFASTDLKGILIEYKNEIRQLDESLDFMPYFLFVLNVLFFNELNEEICNEIFLNESILFELKHKRVSKFLTGYFFVNEKIIYFIDLFLQEGDSLWKKYLTNLRFFPKKTLLACVSGNHLNLLNFICQLDKYVCEIDNEVLLLASYLGHPSIINCVFSHFESNKLIRAYLVTTRVGDNDNEEELEKDVFWTPLKVALKRGHRKVLDTILYISEHVTLLDKPTNENKLKLHDLLYLAADIGNLESFQHILNIYCGTSCPDLRLSYILHNCVRETFLEGEKETKERVGIVKALLSMDKGLLLVTLGDRTPLLEHGVHSDIIIELIEQGADVFFTRLGKFTIAHMISWYLPEDEFIKVVKYLVGKGVGRIFDLVDRHGDRPVDHANRKYSKVPDYSETNKPIIVTALISKHNYLKNDFNDFTLHSENLINNSSGEIGFSSWDITHGGHGWIIENNPIGSDAVPKKEFIGIKGGKNRSCFASSFERCSMKAQVDVYKACKLLVKKPIEDTSYFEIVCGQMFSTRFDMGGEVTWSVKLLDKNQTIIDKHEISLDLPEERLWKEAHHIFTIDTTNTQVAERIRFVEFYYCGKDKSFWAGHYGPKFARSTVVIRAKP